MAVAGRRKRWSRYEGNIWLSARNLLLDEKFGDPEEVLSAEDTELLRLLQVKVAEAFPRVTDEVFLRLEQIQAEVFPETDP